MPLLELSPNNGMGLRLSQSFVFLKNNKGVSKSHSTSGCMSFDFDVKFSDGTFGWHSTGDVGLKC
jgi:hypothetical protein